MERGWLLYIVDVILGLSFLAVFATGVVKFPGLLPWMGVSYGTMPMKALSVIHDWGGVLMGMAALVHLILHWRWIVAMTKRLFTRPQHAPAAAQEARP
jgi:hypothetical protein